MGFLGTLAGFWTGEKTQDEMLQELQALNMLVVQANQKVDKLHLLLAGLLPEQQAEFQANILSYLEQLTQINVGISQQKDRITQQKNNNQKTDVGSFNELIINRSKWLEELIKQIQQTEFSINTVIGNMQNVASSSDATASLRFKDRENDKKAAELTELTTLLSSPKRSMFSDALDSMTNFLQDVVVQKKVVDGLPMEQQLENLKKNIVALDKAIGALPDFLQVVYRQEYQRFFDQWDKITGTMAVLQQGIPISLDHVVSDIAKTSQLVTAGLRQINNIPLYKEIKRLHELMTTLDEIINSVEFSDDQKNNFKKILNIFETQFKQQLERMLKLVDRSEKDQSDELASISKEIDDLTAQVEVLKETILLKSSDELLSQPLQPINKKVSSPAVKRVINLDQDEYNHMVLSVNTSITKIREFSIEKAEHFESELQAITKLENMLDLPQKTSGLRKIQKVVEQELKQYYEDKFAQIYAATCNLLVILEEIDSTEQQQLKNRIDEVRRSKHDYEKKIVLLTKFNVTAKQQIKIFSEKLLVKMDALMLQLKELQASLNLRTNLYGLDSQPIKNEIMELQKQLNQTKQDTSISIIDLKKIIDSVTSQVSILVQRHSEFLQQVANAEEKARIEKARVTAEAIEKARAAYKAVRTEFAQDADNLANIGQQLAQHSLAEAAEPSISTVEYTFGSPLRTIAQLKIIYPEDMDGDVTVVQLNQKIKNLSEIMSFVKERIAKQQKKLEQLNQTLRYRIFAQTKNVQALLAIDAITFASFNIPNHFELAIATKNLHDNQKMALYLVYLGLQDNEKSLLIDAKEHWVEQLTAICEAMPADEADMVISSQNADAATLAGIYLLQLTTQERDVQKLHAQYQKYATGVKNIDQAWKNYLAEKNVESDGQAAQAEKSQKITEIAKVAAVDRVRMPLNQPEWLANPLRKLKEFDQEAAAKNNNQILFKHRHPILNVILAILGTIGFPTLIRSKILYGGCYSFLRPNSKQVCLATQQEAAALVVEAPRAVH